MDDVRALYQLLGDETRLRLLRVLASARLNVPQSFRMAQCEGS